MSQYIEKQCHDCGHMIKMRKAKLGMHMEKLVNLHCSKCGSKTKLYVDEELFKNKDKKTSKHQTQIIDESSPKSSNDGIGRIEIEQDRYTPKQTLKLREGKNILGRQSSDDDDDQNKITIHTEDRTMSRVHCEVTVEQTGNGYQYTLKDMESTNGTYINDEKLGEKDEVYLMDKDVLKLGRARLKFQSQ